MANPRRGIFGAALREAREQAGLSQRALAAQVGRDGTEISRWENGKADPPDKITIAKLDTVLGMEGQLAIAAGYGLQPGDIERARAIVERGIARIMEEFNRVFPEQDEE